MALRFEWIFIWGICEVTSRFQKDFQWQNKPQKSFWRVSKHALDPALIFISKNFCLFSPSKAQTPSNIGYPRKTISIRISSIQLIMLSTWNTFNDIYEAIRNLFWNVIVVELSHSLHLMRACCRCCWCFLTPNRQKIHFYWFVKSSVNNWYDFLRWKRKFRWDNRERVKYQGLVIDSSLKVLSLIKAPLFYGMKIFSFLHLVNCKKHFPIDKEKRYQRQNF